MRRDWRTVAIFAIPVVVAFSLFSCEVDKSTTPDGTGDGTASYTLDGGSATISGRTFTASGNDQSAILVTNGGNLNLRDSSISTTGNTSSEDNSSSYGLNAAVLAQAGGSISLSGCAITTRGAGASGVFATGSSSSVTMMNGTIICAGKSAHGVGAG